MLNNQQEATPPPLQHQQQQFKITSIVSKKSPISAININIPQSMTVFNLKEISSKFQQFKTSITNNQNNINSNKPVSNCSNNLTASSILNAINKEIKTEFTEQSTPKSNQTIVSNNTNISNNHAQAQLPALPYHYSEYENLYVCNLCHLTYDSLRSIKAHIWKHSGHSDLSYPMIDLNNNMTKKLDQTSIKQSTSNAGSTTNSSSTSSGGICSVLLEVIEKLRDEETKTDTIMTDATNQTNTRTSSKSNYNNRSKTLLVLRKRNCNNNNNNNRTHDNKFNCKKIIQKAKHKLRKKLGNKKQERKKLIKKLKLNNIYNSSNTSNNNNEMKECKIETIVLNSLFDDDATLINKEHAYELDTYYHTSSNSIASTSSPSSSSSSSSSSLLNDYAKPNDNNNNILNSDLLNFLSSLANNDDHNEQYVCGLCSYVCYHLPSLKSHMWTHVKSIQFDYSVNTSIINAALDYENKLNRKLNSFKKVNFHLNENESSACNTTTSNKSVFMQRQLNSALELINYPAQQVNELAKYQANNTSPMVSFRCAKCGFKSIDLSVLRLHKREHSK